MAQKFTRRSGSFVASADDAVAVIPNDSTDLATATRGIYVGGAGDLAVRMLSGNNVTLSGVPGGSLLPLSVIRILATGTTASGIVGLL